MISVKFVLPVLFALTLASDKVALHENIVLSILVLSTKKRFLFQSESIENAQNIQWLSHKTCRCLKPGAILKIPSTYTLSVGSKMKPFCVKTKIKSNFAVKLGERNNRSFSIYLMYHFFQTSLLFNMWQWIQTLTKFWHKTSRQCPWMLFLYF